MLSGLAGKEPQREDGNKKRVGAVTRCVADRFLGEKSVASRATYIPKQLNSPGHETQGLAGGADDAGRLGKNYST
jgi:hypothetical protein